MSSDYVAKVTFVADDKVSGPVKNLQTSFGKLTGAMAAGQLAAGLIQKGFSLVKDVVTDSVKEYLSAEKQLGQTDAVLRTMNTSLAEQKSVFDAAGKAALKKAFDDEEAELALAKLYRTTGDMKFSQESLNAAMDLATDKNIELDQAAKMLNLAYAGNVRALREYGIVLPDTASKLDVYNAVMKEVGGEAGEATKTMSGKMKLLNLAVGELKETFGMAVVQGISPYISALTDSAISGNQQLNSTNKLGEAIYRLMGALQMLAGGFTMLGKMAAVAFQVMYIAYLQMRDIFGDFTDQVVQQSKVLDELELDAANSSQSMINGFKKLMGEGWKPVTEAEIKATKENKDYIDATLAASNANETAKKSMEDAAKSAEELAKKLAEAKQKTEDFRLKILDLRADSIVALKEMGARIEQDLVKETQRANDEILKLNDTFEKNKLKLAADNSASVLGIVTNTNTSIAKIIIDKEKEAADLTAKIAAETDDVKKAQLQTELNTINTFLTNNADAYITYAEDLKKARDYYALDEIGKLKADQAEKLALLETENADKLAILTQSHTDQLTLADTQHAENIAKINLQMEETKTAIAKNMKSMFEDLVKSNEMTLIKNVMKEALKFGVTIDMRGTMEEMGFDYLGSMKDVAAAKKAGKTVVNVGGSYYGSRAEGGYVTGGTPYMVGERGPEMFVPNQSGNIVPNNKMGGGININFNNPVVRSDSDLIRIISEVKRVLNREQVVAGLRI